MFAQRLKQLRTAKGWTQRALADALTLSHGTIGMYESGAREPDHDTLRRLADLFTVSIDYLLGRVDDPSDLSSVEIARHALTRARHLHEELTVRNHDLLRQLQGNLTPEQRTTVNNKLEITTHDLDNARDELEAAQYDLRLAQEEYERLRSALRTPTDELIVHLKGRRLTEEQVRVLRDLVDQLAPRAEDENKP